MWVFLNDRFVPEEEARVSVLDHGFLYGDGVYETLRAYAGRVFLLSRHLSRLARSAELIGLPLPFAEHEWARLVGEALRRNQLDAKAEPGRGPTPDAYIRITVSRGKGEIGLDPNLCAGPTVVILAKPLSRYPPTLYTQGVRLSLVSVRRNLAAALPPRIKSLNFLNNILAKQEATRSGAFDALMLNYDGAVAECTTSNLFLVRQGRVCTPSLECGILDGVTRAVVLQLSLENDLPTEEGVYTPKDLLEADECFLTNTSMEVLPVIGVDSSTIGSGRPGPLTARLRALFRDNLPRFLSDLRPGPGAPFPTEGGFDNLAGRC